MENEKGKLLVRKNKKLNQESILIISTVLIIIIIDQVFKIWTQNSGEISIISGILSFKVSQNTKAAYGIGSNSTLMYVATNIVILGIIFKFITTQNEFVDRKFKIFLSFILAGGISNVIERVIRGYVTEFIVFEKLPILPVLNLADIFVLIGWIAVAAIFATFTIKEYRSKKLDSNLMDEDKK